MTHIAVIGAGPSGVLAAAELLACPDVHVDVFDALPTPFGLVRYGVAPDHMEIKSMTTTLSKVFADSRARLFGNVTLGADLGLDELRAGYDAVLVATGAPHARRLGIPGEDLPGSYAAADLVSRYNGHPCTGTPYATRADPVAIIGAGNVSIDAARVLLKAGGGVADAKFSLRTTDRAVTARFHTFHRWAGQPRRGAAKQLHFRFLRAPATILGEERVTGLRLRRSVAAATVGPASTTVIEDLPAQAVVRSIGYSGEPLPGLPFDADLGLIPNTAGRIRPGLHAAGWIKRGPSGVPERRRGVVTWDGWRAIDAAEIDLAQPAAALAPRSATCASW